MRVILIKRYNGINKDLREYHKSKSKKEYGKPFSTFFDYAKKREIGFIIKQEK